LANKNEIKFGDIFNTDPFAPHRFNLSNNIMNKSFVLIFSATMLVASCGGDTPKHEPAREAPATEPVTTVNPPAAVSVHDSAQQFEADAKNVLLGIWVGEMSGKKLSIVIEKIGENTLSGYNILGTNRRDVKGTFKDGSWDIPCGKAFEATLNEPGDDKYDGVFSIKFVGYEDLEVLDGGPECKGNLKGVEAIGTWTSNATKKVKDIMLTKQ